ncbi:MAG TPA: glycogen/starch/alpha-glucan phosphorylase [Acholeplasmataceae bacterium]|jgi:starch phosphorylase|nr:glycogen/starch/alpha-glucan phosphorylase [Acholeplasmataceae bacterium]
MTKYNIKAMVDDYLAKTYGITLADADLDQLFRACATAVNDILRSLRRNYNAKVKEHKRRRVYYLCMEFLLGKSLKNNIHNLGLTAAFSELLKPLGYSPEDLYEYEPDAGLGNGGLGRLAAAYLDALATGGYPAMGFSLRYEYGLFKQKIVNGWQTELPDVWLPVGEVWLTPREDKSCIVRFDGVVEEKQINGRVVYEHRDYKEVEAVPYDMMISGADSEAISVLRLWRSTNVKTFDIGLFSQGDYMKAMQEYNKAEVITKVLYPTDDHYQGKTLRLKQQYFLASASIQTIVRDHIRYYGDVRSLPKYVAIHINDTHPALCVPELIRVLIDEHGLDFDEAWAIARKTVAYTNHTVMAEALECWAEDLIARKLPRIYLILKQINEKFLNEARCHGFDDNGLRALSLFSDNHVRMANLCVAASHTVNGVSKLHSEIIKEKVFRDFHLLSPEKFTNVTNGITYRRWLNQANPLLAAFLDERIGRDYYRDAARLEELLRYREDGEALSALENIKYQNKCRLAKYLYRKHGIVIDPKTRFDIHIKRIHEYKRQLINVLKIVLLLTELEENPQLPVTPQTFIFAGKAAPGYFAAKEVIELINCLAAEIEKNSFIREKLNVIFVEDYNVTLAEMLIPAAEVSEQISLAGKEASGTGNMKFMINGALTFGTLDGANIEIREAVGDENMFIFGMTASEVEALWQRGYNAGEYYVNSPAIMKVIDRLNRGFAGKSFDNITRYLLHNYPVSDPYMCLADFQSYIDVYRKLDAVYQDRRRWNQMALVNIAKAGIFSADRSVAEYAQNIWRLQRVE